MELIKDGGMLLSVLNTKLRDGNMNLKDLCEEWDVSEDEVNARLNGIGFYYDEDKNAFVAK